MKAEFVGPGSWSDPTKWADGAVPKSSSGLHVQLDTNSLLDVGSAESPFLTNDVIGVSDGLNFPQMSISGFLYMHDLENLFTLNVLPAPEFETSGPPGHLYISHDLVNTQQATVIGNAVLGVGHNVGATSFELLAGRGDLSTLILDKPPHDSLSNLVDFELSTSPAAARLELGGIAFDQAAYTRAGSTGSLQLMNQGRPVYQLTNVSVFGGSFTTGFDPHTGYDYVLYSSG